MDEPDETILVCLPTKGVPKAPVPGGVKRLCCRCGDQVWVAPSGLREQRERGAVLLCIDCFFKEEALDETVKINPYTPAQEKEILAFLKEQGS